MKNCFLYFDNYCQFNHYISNNTDFPFRDYYDKNYSSKDIYILKYPLLIMENFEENYSKNNFIFNSLKNNDFKNLEKIFHINKDLSNHSDITDLLFCLSVNNILSYYFSEEKETYNNKIKCLKKEFRKLFSSNLIIPSMNINLLNHVFDFSNFINIIVTKMNINLKNFKQEQFEILMYSLRFVLKSSQFNKNNFYYNILASNSKEYIKNNYIIGNYPFHNIVINSYNDLNILLNDPKINQRVGFYVCTCGQYYWVQNCLVPRGIQNCLNPNCNLKIGRLGVKLLGNEEGQTDHFAVLLNEQDKESFGRLKKEIDSGRVRYILFSEYKKKYVDKYLYKQTKGINKEEIDYDYNINFNVRKMDEFTFIFLNYLLFSHLFFSNVLGNLSDSDIKQYIKEPFTCWNIIEKNILLLEKILNENGIDNIKIFFNINFEKIVNLIKNIEDMSTIEKRENFEIYANNYINEIIKDKNGYERDKLKYKSYNETLIKSKPESIVNIISENYNPFENSYYKIVYPNIEKFLISKYPNLNDLETCLERENDYMKKYCLLYQVLKYNSEYELIESVININKLVNKLMKKFNFKITREEAKTKKILECFDDNENIEDIKSNLLLPYIESWDKIKEKCNKYSCENEMQVLNLTLDHTLIYFLPDEGDIYGGMYLASAYNKIVEWQNNFINIIINSLKKIIYLVLIYQN